jgi:hypothetical protein
MRLSKKRTEIKKNGAYDPKYLPYAGFIKIPLIDIDDIEANPPTVAILEKFLVLSVSEGLISTKEARHID